MVDGVTRGPVRRNRLRRSKCRGAERPYGRAAPFELGRCDCGYPARRMARRLAVDVHLYGRRALGAERLRRRSQPVSDDALSALCDRLADALGVRSRVAVGVCDRVAVPLVLGIARPLIVVPSALVTGWSPEQVELALLHELADVRRWDNLANLLQRVVESALFFHPAVWVLSGWVRREREHCCDRIVVRLTGRALDYAVRCSCWPAPPPRRSRRRRAWLRITWSTAFGGFSIPRTVR